MIKKNRLEEFFGGKSNFTIIDGGSRNGAIDLSSLNSFCKFYCFEPDENSTDKEPQSINTSRDGLVNWSKYALCNHDGKTKINISRRANASSTIKPNIECLKHFPLDNWSELSEIVEEVEVPCTRLKTFLQENKIDNIDLLKLDTQGNELDIIKSLDERIKNVSVIKTEVEMLPLYKDQPLYHDVSKYLYLNGFELVDFEIMEPCKRFHARADLPPSSYRLVWSDAIFVRDPYNFKDPRALQKAMILGSLGYSDLSIYIIKNIDYINQEDFLLLEKFILSFKIPRTLKGKLRFFVEKYFGLIIKLYDWKKGKQVASTKFNK